MSQSCIIIGASHAAAQACLSLRQGGWEGAITVIGEEDTLPYHRPPLSKEFLAGDKELDDILIRPATVYEKADVTFRLGERVEAIHPRAHTITVSSGEILTYDKLILATGARARPLPIPGQVLPGVHYLRHTEDVLAIKSEVAKSRRAVIIGGGYIGLEAAASLRKQGMEVTVLEAMERILQRVTCTELSDFYRRVHVEEGVTIHEATIASAIERQGDELLVQTENGLSFPADMVIIGIGVIPNTELAEEAGLAVANGIEVNEFCQTSDPDIYAAGDVTWHFNSHCERHVRLESVPNATEQAKTVAAHINGKSQPYQSLPWFWSDQYDLKLQIAGLFNDHDEMVVRGSLDQGRSVAVFYYRGEKLLAVDAVNDPRSFMAARMALTKGQTINKKMAADPASDLKDAIQ